MGNPLYNWRVVTTEDIFARSIPSERRTFPTLLQLILICSPMTDGYEDLKKSTSNQNNSFPKFWLLLGPGLDLQPSIDSTHC